MELMMMIIDHAIQAKLFLLFSINSTFTQLLFNNQQNQEKDRVLNFNLFLYINIPLLASTMKKIFGKQEDDEEQ